MQTDWIGEWFRVFEDMGESVDILCAQIDKDDRTIRWYRQSHTKVDGLGALMEIFDQHGAKITEVPTYVGRTPLLPERLVAFARYIRARPALSPSRRVRTEQPGPPAGVAWAILSPEATLRVQKAARTARVNLNVYMLHALNRAVAKEGLATNEVPAWLVPINLRGAVKLENPRANHSSFLSVSIGADSTPRDVHDRLRDQLKLGAHFGAWTAMNLGKVMGLERYRKRTRGLLDKPFGWTGVFSNLGVWSGQHVSLTEQMAGSWLGCPPSSRKVPISFGCLVFNRRLGIGAQIHPSLAEGEAPPRALVARYVEEALSGPLAADAAKFGWSPWDTISESSTANRAVPS